MAHFNFETHLTRLDQAMRAFGRSDGGEVARLLQAIGGHAFRDAESLIRFHEALLFIRAYPQNPASFDAAEALLSAFADRVDGLCKEGVEPPLFDTVENSGIAGTTLHGFFSYGIARWLATRRSNAVEIDWARIQKTERLGYVLPKVLPLLEEEALVEQNIPYATWLSSAKGRAGRDLRFLIDCFERSPLSEAEKSRLYDLLELWIRWTLGRSQSSRTANRRKPRKVFYHSGPLIRRADVSLEKEALTPIRLEALPLERATTILDMCRDATSVRYRELYGIPYGDATSAVRAEVGRGTEIYLWGLPPERRLPLRAYHAGFTLKNGVPINYIEGISLFERTELGFNTFYTYRDGETGWVYAQAVRVLHHLIGSMCFSLDPYQIGFNNDEAIQSGAFWFYRKLGFRSTQPNLARLTEAQEAKQRTEPGYRSSPRILRRLSQAPMIFELPDRGAQRGEWDRFRIRNIGLAVQRRMAREFGGSAEAIRLASLREVSRALGASLAPKDAPSRRAVEGLALALALIPELANWSRDDKDKLRAIVRAKWQKSDADYVRLVQQHERLRKVMIELGSRPHEAIAF
ncbi:MAG TPA: hypothetical protein VEZ90_02655 [Blastocatellia bacterium]|nr:hypothetical protein [Blastocatellia bacterium]